MVKRDELGRGEGVTGLYAIDLESANGSSLNGGAVGGGEVCAGFWGGCVEVWGEVRGNMLLCCPRGRLGRRRCRTLMLMLWRIKVEYGRVSDDGGLYFVG